VSQQELIAAALREVPDLPHWVDTRALLLSNNCRVFGGVGGFLARNEAEGGQLVAVIGKPPAVAFDEALTGREEAEILCAPADAEHVGMQLTDWKRESVVQLTLAAPARLADVDDRVRRLASTDSLTHLTEELRDEIDQARREVDVIAAFEDGVAASFAYTCWKTEKHCDVSIDTVEAYRRRGLARAAVSELIRRERARGLKPVWGAVATNVASQRLAESLGFERAGEMVFFTQPQESRH